ncbi:formylglycine-generating enzyme family protein [Candidatus Sumerlaeota bacterium]
MKYWKEIALSLCLVSLFVCAARRKYMVIMAGEVPIKLVLIKGGEAFIGAAEDDSLAADDSNPQTQLQLSGFYMGVCEITNAQFEAVMGYVPSEVKAPQCPVTNVHWPVAVKFCERLGSLTGKNVSLPTEAQWEYACRAGTEAPWYFHPDPEDYEDYCMMYVTPDEEYLSEWMWYEKNSSNTTHPVGLKKPNPSGLFDMYGNVEEWCLSDYRPYPYDELDGRNSLDLPSARRVMRGGSYCDHRGYCNSVQRQAHDIPLNIGSPSTGMRIVINE